MISLFLLALALPLTGQKKTSEADMYMVFNNNKVYGAYCGIAGTHPPSRMLIEKFIIDQNMTQINEWQNSPNSVIRTYAAEALIRLHNEGMKLSEVELIFISEMKENDELISSCRGCIHSMITIREALYDYKLKGL